MGDLTRNFSRKEFACHCGCGFDTADYELVVLLQDLADHFGKPVIITGPDRCLAHNTAVKGAKASYHMKGMAADIKVSGIPLADVYDYLDKKYPDRNGVKLYSSWVHVDVRKNKWRER